MASRSESSARTTRVPVFSSRSAELAAENRETAVTEVDLSAEEFYHSWPTFLADGEHFLYFRSGPDEIQGIYVGSLGVEPGKQSRQRLLPSAVPAAYARGYLFFVRAGTLMAQRFDDRRLQLEGVPVPVAGDIGYTFPVENATMRDRA